MFPASLPFDYLRHLDRHDRVRRTGSARRDNRVRRLVPSRGLNT